MIPKEINWVKTSESLPEVYHAILFIAGEKVNYGVLTNTPTGKMWVSLDGLTNYTLVDVGYWAELPTPEGD